MCYSPIRIQNNRRNYRPMLDQMYITVPCGKCAECIASARDDWFVRLQYEWQSVVSKGGCGMFITATYNQFHHPSLDIHDEKFSVVDEWFKFLSCSPFYSSVLGDSVDHYEEYHGTPYVFNTSKLDFGMELDNGFCKRDLQLFLKKLRQRIARKYGVSEVDIKYYIICEHGEDYSRTHYHILFFLPFTPDPLLFLKMVQFCWSILITKDNYPDWILPYIDTAKKGSITKVSTPNPLGKQYNDWYIIKSSNNSVRVYHILGFCNYSKDKITKEIKPFIETSKCLSYVVKYFHKTDEYSNTDNYKKFYDWYKVLRRSYYQYVSLCKDHPNLSRFHGERKLQSVIRSISDYFPFTLASKGIGSQLLEEIYKMSDSQKKLYLSHDKPVTIEGHEKKYRVPSYILSRLFYTKVDTPTHDTPFRFLTPLGLECAKLRFDLRLDSFVHSVSDIMCKYKNTLSDNDKDYFRDKFGISLNEFDKIYTDTFSCIDCTPTTLGIYSIVFRNLELPPSYRSMFEDYALSDLESIAYDFFDKKLATQNDTLPFDLHICEYYKGHVFNTLPQFQYFDFALDCIDWIKNRIKSNDYADQKKENDSIDVKKKSLLDLMYN